MKRTLLLGIAVSFSAMMLAANIDGSTNLAAKCTGAKNCKACKNCKSCKYCKGAGTCGVCK